MTMDQVRDFARTPRKGLPEHAPKHMADGCGAHMADGGMFVEREGVAPGGAHWMELVRSNTIPDDRLPSERPPMRHMADGRKTMGRGRPYYGEHMADGKWAAEAFKPSHKGMLHRALHVPEGEKIPAGKMQSALHSKNSHVRHMAQAAKNI